MTDEIHGDKALLHSILNGETKKKKAFHFRPAYTAALTAMFVAAATTLYFSAGINDHSATSQSVISTPQTSPITAQPTDEPETDLQPEAKADEKSTPKDTYSYADALQSDVLTGQTEEKNAALAPAAADDFPAVEDNAVAAQSEAAPVESKKLDAAAGDSSRETVQQESIAAAISETEHTAATEAAFDSHSTYNGSSSHSGSSSSAVGGAGGGSSRASVSNSDYYRGIISSLRLPADVVPTRSLAETSVSGFADPLTIFASSKSGERSVTITLSKQSDLSSIVPNGIYAQVNGLYIAVTAQNLTENEISDIIVSLS